MYSKEVWLLKHNSKDFFQMSWKTSVYNTKDPLVAEHFGTKELATKKKDKLANKEEYTEVFANITIQINEGD